MDVLNKKYFRERTTDNSIVLAFVGLIYSIEYIKIRDAMFYLSVI